MFKVGAMSYSLAGLLESEEPTWQRLLEVAADVGADGIEFYDSHWGVTPEDVKCADEVRTRAEALGIEVFALGSGARLGFADERRDEAVETLRTQIRAAAAVGAEVVTFPAIDAPPVPPGRDPAQGGLDFGAGAGPLVQQVKELADFAGEHSVRLALLNHCFFICSSWHQEWVAKLSGSDCVGACLDPGNYLYYAGEDPVSATGRLAGNIHMVRLGDWVRRDESEVAAGFEEGRRLQLYQGAPFGEGEVNHAGCFRILKESGYRGFLSMKSAGPSTDGPTAALRKALERVKAMVGTVE